jgi:hypothetical protein
MTDFYNLVPSAPKGRFDGIERPYTAEKWSGCADRWQIRHTLAARGANRLWKLIHEEDFVNALGAVTGNQAMQMVRAGLKAIYLSGWQVAADANTAVRDVSRPVALSGQCRTGALPSASTARCSAPTRSRRSEGNGLSVDLVRADRRRCRSRLRRPAQRLRDHEGLHRGRRAGGALRGPAGVGEEVRPSRRQGADPDRGAYPQPRSPRGSPPTSWARRDADRRAHRRRGGEADSPPISTSATGPSSTRRADGGRLLSSLKEPGSSTASRAASPSRPMRSDLVETSQPDLERGARKFAEAVHKALSRQAARL